MRQLALGFVWALGLMLGACGEARNPNELVVGMDLSYPPFETITPEGNPPG